MKITNFRDLKHNGLPIHRRQYSATVDVETGTWWSKKIEPKEIVRKYAGCWFFIDTGEWTPTFEVEKLERAYRAKTGEEE